MLWEYRFVEGVASQIDDHRLWTKILPFTSLYRMLSCLFIDKETMKRATGFNIGVGDAKQMLRSSSI